MTLSLTAYLNQRFQFSYNVASYATLYTSLSSAAWRMQVRPQAGSPVVTLDFLTGGSLQSAYLTAAYNGGTVVFRAPTSLIQSIPAGAYSFDFGFVLPGADFERVNGGTMTFVPGVTLAGVAGTPSAPSNADDTVLNTGN